MKNRLIILIVIMLLIILAACNREEANETEEEERITAVEVAEVTEGDFTLEREVYGRTSPNRTTPVMVQAPGEVKSLGVSNGEIVEEGELVATILTAAGNQSITANSDGEITSLAVEEGDLASAEEPLAILAEMNPMKLDITATAKVRELFTVKEMVKVLLEGEEFEGTVTKVDSMPDDTGLYPITVTVNNEEGGILPGIIGTIIIPDERIESAILVPTEAIVEENEEAYVYVVKDDIAEKRAVTILAAGSDVTAIEGDVKPKDSVITTGQLTLSDGKQVKVTGGE
ncbi:efflux RND transporter periplasmic adaptor subunit [Oceanobacillus piezotolerans]|uniref:Efflux RND transporter periplasmic adaptor subunit n=1 Tax=Oceanobacillus piezotolerans TaxID=2448030 RepID=A0A498D9F9_9BACI|nr:efflux RND transporter periplasmic adaptor subunit [Oceanobacillus piezotolerans]RLL42936.1 efflux RND transporter periplasmic adaptor subunit [Oceanobacillus piezotolerans]